MGTLPTSKDDGGVAHPYYTVKARMDRAAEHLDVLEGEVEDFLSSGVYRTFPDVDTASNLALMRVRVSAEPPTLKWAVIVGDVLHNLRSSLDHLVWQLGGHKNPNERDSGFPICAERRDYRRAASKNLFGLPDEAQAIIEDLQPFQRDNSHLHPLWMLHKLSNLDKHRLPRLAVVQVTGASYFVEALPGSASEDCLRLGEPVTDGAILAAWPLDTHAKPQADQPFVFDFGVTFADGPNAGSPVIQALRRYQQAVQNEVVVRLAPFLFD